MPTTIGALDNVPAPGDPITSPWAQEASGYLVHPFANVAAINAQWPAAPNGSQALALDTGIHYERRAGVWRQRGGALYSSWLTDAVESGDIGATAVNSMTATVAMEQGRLYSIEAMQSIIYRAAGTTAGLIRILVAGVAVLQAQTPVGLGANAAWAIPLHYDYRQTAATGNVTVNIDLRAPTGPPIRFIRAVGYPMGLSITDITT